MTDEVDEVPDDQQRHAGPAELPFGLAQIRDARHVRLALHGEQNGRVEQEYDASTQTSCLAVQLPSGTRAIAGQRRQPDEHGVGEVRPVEPLLAGRAAAQAEERRGGGGRDKRNLERRRAEGGERGRIQQRYGVDHRLDDEHGQVELDERVAQQRGDNRTRERGGH